MQLPNNRLLLVIFMAMSFLAFSQESTPYSRFGLGYIQDLDNISSAGMGGLGTSYRNTESVSFYNPASYSAIRLTGFEIGMGLSANRQKMQDGNDIRKGSTFKGNVHNLSLSLPIKKNWGVSAGLIPYTVKDYTIQDTFLTGDGQKNIRTYEGSGGMYTAYVGSGYNIKGFSIGFNTGYMFGKLENYVLVSPMDTSGALDTRGYSSIRINNLRVHGINWNLGVQYDAKLTEKLNVVIGVAGNAGTKLSSKNELTGGFYTVPNHFVTSYKTDNENIPDFLELLNGSGVDTLKSVDEKITLKLPSTLCFGFTFQNKTSWKAGFDLRYQVWSKYENYEPSSIAKYSNSWRVGFGGEWLPKSTTQNTNFLQRIKYRAGVYAQKTNLELNGTDIKEFGVSFGFGLPVTAALSDDNGFIQRYMLHPFNIGFEAGSRGTTANGLLKENFFRMKFGLTLSDKWFVKRKYL